MATKSRLTFADLDAKRTDSERIDRLKREMEEYQARQEQSLSDTLLTLGRLDSRLEATKDAVNDIFESMEENSAKNGALLIEVKRDLGKMDSELTQLRLAQAEMSGLLKGGPTISLTQTQASDGSTAVGRDANVEGDLAGRDVKKDG